VPTVIIIAGPNGAGKTTFANEYLSLEERRFDFVNADEIGRELAAQNPYSDVLAARLMLRRVDALLDAGADFVVETTLASLTYAQKVPVWRKRGYIVSLVYLRLASVAESLARVRKRVAAGGHDIPPAHIQRRFQKSLMYFDTIYKPLVDEWYIWESREGRFLMVDSWDERHASGA
jgi:predicted ABC-type ATPase